jgi:hypothetical protein
MSGYWSEVLRLWPKAFVDFTKSWWFWFVNVIPGLRTFLSADVQESIGLDALPPWLLGASVVASAFVALLLAGRDRYKELSDAHARRGDELVAATEAQARAESGRDSYKAKVDRVWNSDILALEKFAVEGQEIIQAIQSRSWAESSGELLAEWVRKVEAFIKGYRPTYMSLFRKEPPNMPVAFSGDADRMRTSTA